jgi:hypothetical protein
MFPLWSVLLGGSFVVVDAWVLVPCFFFLGALIILWLVGFHQCMTKLVEE